MAKSDSVRIALRLKLPLSTGLEDWRAKQRPLPTLTDAIERAIAEMLERDGILKPGEFVPGPHVSPPQEDKASNGATQRINEQA